MTIRSAYAKDVTPGALLLRHNLKFYRVLASRTEQRERVSVQTWIILTVRHPDGTELELSYHPSDHLDVLADDPTPPTSESPPVLGGAH